MNIDLKQSVTEVYSFIIQQRVDRLTILEKEGRLIDLLHKYLTNWHITIGKVWIPYEQPQICFWTGKEQDLLIGFSMRIEDLD